MNEHCMALQCTCHGNYRVECDFNVQLPDVAIIHRKWDNVCLNYSLKRTNKSK
jgi:hypothetical protein